MSQTSITFLDTEVSIKKKSCHKNLSEKLLHVDLEHPKSLEDRIPYSQARTI